MLKFIKRKRGGVSVFITMILSSMILAVTVIGNAAFARLEESAVDAALRIGSRSVLSEYDYRLAEDYDIYAYRYTADEVANKLENYAECNLDCNFRKISNVELQVDIENINYNLIEGEIITKQLVEAGRTSTLKGDVRTERPAPAVAERALSNQAIIKTMPSGGKTLRTLNVEGFNGINDIGSQASETYLIDSYIRSHFKSRYYDISGRAGHYNYEIEYILSGKLDEKSSLKFIKNRLKLMRTALNTAHIMSDPAKLAEAEAYAASIPTPGDPVETAVIVEIWAMAEADNDVELLLGGKNVAFVKTKAQWALPLKTAVKNWIADGYIEPPDKKGERYDDYLDIMLHLADREAKLLRIEDLIQINLRESYYDSFLIKDHFTGFDLSAEADGKEYLYAQMY